MLLIDAMFLWNPLDRTDKIPFATHVKVVPHSDGDKNRAFNYLTKSMGACCAGWRDATGAERAGHALALFHQMVLDGIDPKEIHDAFMVIGEYHAYADGDQSGDNPFAHVRWAFLEKIDVAIAAAPR